MALTAPGPPPYVPGVPSALLKRARATLGLNQSQAAELLFTSRRNVIRWEQAAVFTVAIAGLRELTRLAASVDLGLAGELASALGATLEGLGLVAPSKPPATPPPVIRTIDVAQLAHLALFAGAEAAQVSPHVVRTVVRAVLVQAEALGLSIDELKAATTPRA